VQSVNISAESHPRYNTRQDMLELSAVFILISLACFYYREPILSFLTSPLQGKQRLADGAFIAALMDQMGGNAETVATDVEAAGGGSGRKRGLIADSARQHERAEPQPAGCQPTRRQL
jgi:hypothetical protein